MTRQEFVQTYYPAVAALTAGTGIFPETVLSAAILESSDANGNVGASTLASKYNNYFGLKAGTSWQGKVVDMPTYEYQNGQRVLVHDYFRVYPSFIDSAADYVRLLTTASRYQIVRDSTSPEQQFQMLQKAGYATDPAYAAKLLSIYNDIRGFIASHPAGTAAGLAVVGLAALLYYLLTKR